MELNEWHKECIEYMDKLTNQEIYDILHSNIYDELYDCAEFYVMYYLENNKEAEKKRITPSLDNISE